MRPASSVILFTTASGAGYGLLLLLGIAAAFGLLPAAPWFGFVALALSLGLISLGLLASTFHLGHPERAWRALSQWRSSWLSREGVMAVLTYIPAGLFAVGWVLLGTTSGVWALCGLLAALGAALTVLCTGMIYASLRTIRQWHNPWVVPGYLGFALATGALWLNVLLHAFGMAAPWSNLLPILGLALAWGLKAAYWRDIDRGRGASSPESATGLGALGKVRLLDPPHTQENYLQHELGFQVARKHAAKLRRIALVFGFALAFGFAVLALVATGWLAGLAALLAALAGSLGVVLERWLFFAEATHTVTLYYGAQAA